MAERRISLEISEGKGLGQGWELEPPCSVGRAKSCSVVVNDPDVSRLHCLIEFEANELTLRDNGSSNGTFLNGRRVQLAALRDGDLITVGATMFTLRTGVARARPHESVVAATSLSLSGSPFHELGPEAGADALARALAKYRVLFQTSEVLERLGRLKGFLHLVLEQLFDVTAATRGLVIFGTRVDRLEIAAKLARDTASKVQPLSTTLLERVLTQREALLVTDSLLDERLYGADSVLGSASRSIVCVPLAYGDTLFGALQLESLSERHAFDENELKLVAALGRQIAVTLAQQRSEDERQLAVERANLRRFVCAAHAERLLDGPADWRKAQQLRLSFLVLDLRALMTAAHDERSRDAVNAWCDWLESIVFEHEGTLGRLNAGALVAFWGAPVEMSEREGARQAARAALVIQSEWGKRAALLPEAGSLRVGLHYGEALVGELGSSAWREYSAVGSEVGRAVGLLASCPHDTVAASREFQEVLSTQLAGEWTGESASRLFAVRGLRAG